MKIDSEKLIALCKRIDSYASEAVDIQKSITAVPALSPVSGGDGEQAKAEVLTAYLKQVLQCDEVQTYNAPDDRVSSGVRPNIVGRIKGKSSNRTIWIMSHTDVVPPGDLSKWTGDPWKVRVDGDKIYGRGTEDNQQGIVSSLLAVKAFRDEGITPEYDIALLLVADEETGSEFGIQYLLDKHTELFSADDYILIPDAGNEDGTLVEVAEKSIVWFKFRVLGKQTHGSTPELGVNAMRAGANLVVQLSNLYELFPASDTVFEPPISTFEPTKKEANVPNVNTIPGEDIFYLDCRLLPTYEVTELETAVQKICDQVAARHNVSIEIGLDQCLRAPAPTPVDAPVVRALQAGIEKIMGKETRPMGIGGGTVAAYFRQAGLSAVVWATQDETLHEPNEYVRISYMLNDAKVFSYIALLP